MGFTGNPIGVRRVLLLIIILFALGAMGFCHKAKADEPPTICWRGQECTGLSLGFGIAGGGSDVACWGAFQAAQEFGDRKWLAALATHGQGRCQDEPMRANILAGVLRTTDLGILTIGIGAGFMIRGDIIVGPISLDEQLDHPPRLTDTMQMCANLLLRIHLGKRVVTDLLHCSTGGTTEYNRGDNFVTVGLRF